MYDGGSSGDDWSWEAVGKMMAVAAQVCRHSSEGMGMYCIVTRMVCGFHYHSAVNQHFSNLLMNEFVSKITVPGSSVT